MGSPLVIPFLLFLIEFVSLSAASSLCQNDQSLALLQFKQSFNITTDPFDSCAYYSYDDQNSYPRTSSWNSSIDCCMWDGVTCDELSGEVIELDLSCSLLVGTIHSNSSLFHLSHLKRLNLARNYFYPSSISHKFGDFSYLTHLNLSHSSFSGQIPTNVLRLPNLVSLDLSWDYDLILEPHHFEFLLQNSTQIREILLDQIPIDSMIPPNLSSQITILSLSATGLRGSLPSSIFRLPNLNRLILSNNEDLTVHFPNARWNNSLSITDLDFGNTICSPNIVESLVNLSSVKYLGLANCGLSGKVPETILSLKQLTTLYLSLNNLEGGFADLFIKLWRVKKLYLSDNNIIGQFPSSTNITQLEILDVRNNSLYGTLPSWLFNLSTLYQLDLNYNRLQGSIPSSLSKNKNLRYLLLSSNNFSGNIELTMFSNLKRLWALDLSNNRLSVVSNSEINSTGWSKDLSSLRLSSCNLMNLSFLRDLKSLELLDLSNNKIQGRIPEWAWSNWRDNLWSLNLSHNYLTSVEGIQQLHSIDLIDLRFNLLEGPLPILPTDLDYFFASQNNLSGEVPLSLCNLSYVRILDLANNSLSGAVPQCLGNSSSMFLEVLDMHNNELRGSIPSNLFAGNQWLHTLNLRENKLEGRIPRSKASCTNLEVLDLGSNKLSDIFPEWLVKLPRLQVLSLRSNNFHGTITTSSTAKNMSSQLKIIDLSHNDFTGHLPVWLFNSLSALQNTDDERKPPSYFGDENNYYKDSLVCVLKGNEFTFEKILTVYTTIDLSSNKFEGNIPGVIGQLLFLRGLNLSHNMLCGSIPHSLGNLSRLESLDLSSNQLVGEIPNELAALTFLAVFNLSNNHLTGCIPKGEQFNTFDNTSYRGNEGLLGFPMTKDCGNGGTSPQEEEEEEEEEDSNESILDEGFSWKAVLLGYGCGIVFGFVVGSLMLLTRKPYCLTRIAEEEAYKIMMKAKRKRKNTPRSGRRRSS